jgi:hypothetical protein
MPIPGLKAASHCSVMRHHVFDIALMEGESRCQKYQLVGGTIRCRGPFGLTAGDGICSKSIITLYRKDTLCNSYLHRNSKRVGP